MTAHRVDENTPQPASGPMSREVADWYVTFTNGQFVAFQHQDGHWYLHTPEQCPTQDAIGPVTS